MIPIQWEHLPDELRYVPKWCIAGPDKAPYTVAGARASVTSPSTWSDWYSAAMTAAQWGNGAGIGFILSDDDEFTCIDLDVKDASNEADASKWTTAEQMGRYHKIVEAFNSYTEWSRSGKGFHIWVRGKIGQGCRRDGVEVYSQQRFIICTGNAILNRPVEHRQELLDMLVGEMRAAAGTTQVALVEKDAVVTDDLLWHKALTAENGDKFRQLCEGRWQEMGYPSQSEADLSLLSMFCFYSRSNEQVRRLFRLTALGQRDKAQKNDRYLNRTLSTIRGRQEREDREIAVAQANSVQLVARAAPVKLLPVVSTSTLAWPPGVVGYVAKWFYSIAPRPVKEVAIVSALGFFAGICGKSFNISGSGLNLYIVLVARSAVGKEAMHSGISKLLHHLLSTASAVTEHVDFADYASGPALIKAIAQKQSFVNVAGEWGRKLRKMSDDHTEGPMSSLRTVMTNLYQKSGAGTIVGGIGYSDKEKDVKSVDGVAYSMIGETTPDTFYESLTNTMMQDGFMSRFIVVEYNGLRPELNPATDQPLSDEFYTHMTNLIERARSILTYQDVVIDKEAQEMLDSFNVECDLNINGTDDESWRQMWNRAHLKALKVSGLLAAVDNCMNPVVTVAHATWALDLIRRDIKLMARKIVDGDVGDGDAVRERKMLSIMADYLKTGVADGYKLPDEMRKAGVIARKYLQIRLQKINSFVKHRAGQSAALDLTLKSLIDSGYIVEVSKDKIPAEWNFSGKCYRILSLPDVVS